MSDFVGTIKDATWKMCNWQRVFLSCLQPLHTYIQGLTSRAQRTWEYAFCPPLYPHLSIPVFTLRGIFGPLPFTVLLHCCTAKTENPGWELAQLVQYYCTRIRTQVQIPRDYAKVWVLQCTAVIPVLTTERTETGQSRDPVD